MAPTHQLTELQLAILRTLWQRGRASVAEVAEALRGDRDLAQTTVATMLSRLEKRGIVDHETEGRQFVYYSTVSESEVRVSMVRELTEQLFEGDVTALVSHLLSERELTAGDLARVKAMIEAHEAGKDGARARK